MTKTLLDTLTALYDAGRAAEEGGRWDEALDAYTRLLEKGEEAAELTAEVLRRSGNVHYYRGDLGLAAHMYQASCAAAQARGATKDLASALNGAAVAHHALGQLDQAEACYLRALEAAEQVGYSRLAVMIQQNLATIASVQGDTLGALQRYGSVLKSYESSDDVQGLAGVLNNIGMAHTDLRDWSEAETAFERALTYAEQRNDAEVVGTIQLNRANMYVQQERFEDARHCCDQAFELFGRLGSKLGLGEAYRVYGTIFRASGKLQLADAHLGAVVEIAEAAEYLLLHAQSLMEHALVFLDLGRNADALRALNRAHALFGELRARRELIDVEKRLDALERNYLYVVQVWAESIESKDHYTAGHCSRVADLTARLAAAAGFAGRDLTWIRMGAFLHDVGKTEVPAAVLNKPGPLTSEEWVQMRAHTTAGDAIVAELGFPWDIRPIVRNHHERFDGTGYPDQLAGDRIPLAARVLCVADVYDALTTTRSYRVGYSHSEAMAIMESESGTVLDPELFRLFRELINDEPAVPELELQAV
jgi:putative nucleotidyltransferase with HDIG domain